MDGLKTTACRILTQSFSAKHHLLRTLPASVSAPWAQEELQRLTGRTVQDVLDTPLEILRTNGMCKTSRNFTEAWARRIGPSLGMEPMNGHDRRSQSVALTVTAEGHRLLSDEQIVFHLKKQVGRSPAQGQHMACTNLHPPRVTPCGVNVTENPAHVLLCQTSSNGATSSHARLDSATGPPSRLACRY